MLRNGTIPLLFVRTYASLVTYEKRHVQYTPYTYNNKNNNGFKARFSVLRRHRRPAQCSYCTCTNLNGIVRYGAAVLDRCPWYKSLRLLHSTINGIVIFLNQHAYGMGQQY